MKKTYFITFCQLVLVATLSFSSLFAYAATLTMDEGDAATEVNVDLDTLLPLVPGSTWTYNLTRSSVVNKVVAKLGDDETIGGGCLSLRPLQFGQDMTLFLGNQGDELSLYGVYLKRWRGVDDLLIKFETRQRVEWKDFKELFDVANPVVEAHSCQDTGQGFTERKGLVLLENLKTKLGSVNSSADLDCSVKNSDLINTDQHGSGSAAILGIQDSFTWKETGLVRSIDSAGVVNIKFKLIPNIGGKSDYDMDFDITMTPSRGITAVSVTGDGTNDLSFVISEQSIADGSVSRAGGSCPKKGDLGIFFVLLLGFFAGLRQVVVLNKLR